MNTLNRKTLIIAAIVGFFAIASMLVLIQQVKADITADVPTVTVNTFRNYRFFATSTVQTNFATSTPDTAALNYATSTGITAWMDSNGRYDNGSFVIAGAKKVEFSFGRTATTSGTNIGTSGFAIQATSKVSPSESDWFNYTGLAPATTTSMTPTLVPNGNTTGTATIKFTMNNAYESLYAVRCIVTIAVDGQNTCDVAASF